MDSASYCQGPQPPKNARVNEPINGLSGVITGYWPVS
jgi:hypothetical protein